MKLPRPIARLIDHFERLPGIGPKTAQRLVFYLLNFPENEVQNFSEALLEFKSKTQLCTICKNVGEMEICEVCADDTRDKDVIAVVASPLDVFALERARFKGNYHVLHGLIDPLNNIGPDELFINNLVKRISTSEFPLEIVMATNTSMEGESTAMYISKLIRDSGFDEDRVKITRIARGLPVGGDIEYADDTTLLQALQGRNSY